MLEDKTVFRENVHQPLFTLAKLLLFITYISFVAYVVVATSPLPGFLATPEFAIMVKYSFWVFFTGSAMLFLIGAMTHMYVEVGRHNQLESFLRRERRVLEVRLPDGSPESISAMENLLEQVADTSGESGLDSWLKGGLRPVYSFEIVSRGGITVFILFIPKKSYERVLSAIHSFYPYAQVIDADDYSMEVEYNPETHEMHALEWQFSESDVLPLKTYVEFEMRRSEVEPLTLLYDLFGSLRGREQMWIQYIFRAEKYPRAQEKFLTNPVRDAYWKKQTLAERVKAAAEELEKKLREKDSEKEEEGSKEAQPSSMDESRLLVAGRNIIEKQVFEVGVRMIYMAPKEDFLPDRKTQMEAVFSLTKTQGNRLVPVKVTSVLPDQSSPFDTIISFIKSFRPQPPQKKPIDESHVAIYQKTLQLYRDRMFLLSPTYTRYEPPARLELGAVPERPQTNSLLMSSETLATICHFPTRMVRTSTVQRIGAQTISPPENLPI